MPAFMLPPKKGNCLICAVNHPMDFPHDANSLYYGMRFKDKHGRDPTWQDAVAHLPEDMQPVCLEEIKKVYAENNLELRDLPEDVEPIAEPYITDEDQIGNPAIRMNLEPISIAMDGSYAKFKVNIANRDIEAIGAEVEEKLKSVDVEPNLWALKGSIAEAQAMGVQRLEVKWTRKTGIIDAFEVEEGQ